MWDEATCTINCPKPKETVYSSLGEVFFECMKKNRENVAQYIEDTGEVDNYGSLLSRSIRTAINLRKKGIFKNDVVCICSYNHKDTYVPFIASLFLGAVVSSLDSSLTFQECLYLIQLVKPKIFFITPEAIEVIQRAVEAANIDAEIVVFDVGINWKTSNLALVPFKVFLQPAEDEKTYKPEKVDTMETAIIFFSSGTTGFPKGICRNSKGILHTHFVFFNNGSFPNGPSTVILSYSSMYWISAVLLLSSAIQLGASRIISKSFNAEKTWMVLDKYKVNFTFLAPIQIYEIMQLEKSNKVDLPELKEILTAGSTISEKILLKLRQLLPNTLVHQCYGCTEVGFVTHFNLNSFNSKLFLQSSLKSCGTPLPGMQYKLVNAETGAICGPHENGQLYLKSEFIMNGYFNQDSSSVYDEDGWLKTGDILYFDENFCFYFVERIKEMIKYRNWQVIPAVIENILYSHEAVKECVVIGIPHETDGDHPAAVVVLKNKFETDKLKKQLIDYIAKRVNDTHKLRGGIFFVDFLRKTPSGKIKRQEIKKNIIKTES